MKFLGIDCKLEVSKPKDNSSHTIFIFPKILSHSFVSIKYILNIFSRVDGRPMYTNKAINVMVKAIKTTIITPFTGIAKIG